MMKNAALMSGMVGLVAAWTVFTGDPTITISSAISNGDLTVTPTGSNGVVCSNACCQLSGGGTVKISYQTNNSQFLYLTDDAGQVSTAPATIVVIGSGSESVEVDFSVVGAASTGGLLWTDPRITVQTGTCQ